MSADETDAVQVVAEALLNAATGRLRSSSATFLGEQIVTALRAAGIIPDPETHVVIAKADLPTQDDVNNVILVGGSRFRARFPYLIRDQETS